MARPATGQTPVVTFRPPQQLRDDFDQEAKASGRTRSDALIEAMHDWLKKRQRERPVSSEETSG
jgi:hypothetical protein